MMVITDCYLNRKESSRVDDVGRLMSATQQEALTHLDMMTMLCVPVQGSDRMCTDGQEDGTLCKERQKRINQHTMSKEYAHILCELSTADGTSRVTQSSLPIFCYGIMADKSKN